MRLDINNKLMFLKKYSNEAISYSTIQDCLEDYYLKDVGFVSYGSKSGYNFILGSPICSAENKFWFIKKIVEDLKNPAFIQINKETTCFLNKYFGYKIAQLGIETEIMIHDYQLTSSPQKRNLRSFLRKGEEQSKVYELTKRERIDDFGIDDSGMRQLSKEYIKIKNQNNEIKYLVRNFVYDDELYVRKFYSIGRDNSLLGFVYFNPIFKDGSIIGYCADQMRASDKASKGHIPYIILSALEKFKSEGRILLSLGLSPFAEVKRTEMKNAFIWHAIFKLAFKYGNFMYNFKGQYEHKKQYRGLEKPVYCATKSINEIAEFLAISRFCGII